MIDYLIFDQIKIIWVKKELNFESYEFFKFLRDFFKFFKIIKLLFI